MISWVFISSPVRKKAGIFRLKGYAYGINLLNLYARLPDLQPVKNYFNHFGEQNVFRVVKPHIFDPYLKTTT